MNLASKIIMFIALAGLALWGLIKLQKDEDDPLQLGQSWKEGKCIKRSSKNFSRWKVNEVGKDIPSSGNHGKIAEEYFNGEPGKAGKVGGFFKGVDTLATLDAARFYKKDMIAWVNSEFAYDWWQMNIGELLCVSDKT